MQYDDNDENDMEEHENGDDELTRHNNRARTPSSGRLGEPRVYTAFGVPKCEQQDNEYDDENDDGGGGGGGVVADEDSNDEQGLDREDAVADGGQAAPAREGVHEVALVTEDEVRAWVRGKLLRVFFLKTTTQL